MLSQPFTFSGQKSSGMVPHRRANPRVRLHIPARLMLIEGIEQCMLADMSISGAGVIPQNINPRVGTSGILQCEKIAIFGEVIWTTGGRSGVKFEKCLPLAAVVAIRHFADTYDAKARAEFLNRARLWVQGGVRNL
jgi:hypothetical protein